MSKNDIESLSMKCRKCRTVLLEYPETRVESSHGALASDALPSQCTSDVWYIPEDNMPSWMTPNIEKGGWVKGKVHCPKCDARLGSYNFVSGMKCPCGVQVVAPIHIVKSKVDFFIPPSGPDSLETEKGLCFAGGSEILTMESTPKTNIQTEAQGLENAENR